MPSTDPTNKNLSTQQTPGSAQTTQASQASTASVPFYKKLFGRQQSPKKRAVLGGLLLVLIMAGLASAMYLVRLDQDIRQRASGNVYMCEISHTWNNNINCVGTPDDIQYNYRITNPTTSCWTSTYEDSYWWGKSVLDFNCVPLYEGGTQCYCGPNWNCHLKKIEDCIAEFGKCGCGGTSSGPCSPSFISATNLDGSDSINIGDQVEIKFYNQEPLVHLGLNSEGLNNFTWQTPDTTAGYTWKWHATATTQGTHSINFTGYTPEAEHLEPSEREPYKCSSQAYISVVDSTTAPTPSPTTDPTAPILPPAVDASFSIDQMRKIVTFQVKSKADLTGNRGYPWDVQLFVHGQTGCEGDPFNPDNLRIFRNALLGPTDVLEQAIMMPADNTTYSMKARASNGTDWSEWTACQNFTIDSCGQDTNRPVDCTCINDSQCYSGYCHVAQAIPLSASCRPISERPAGPQCGSLSMKKIENNIETALTGDQLTSLEAGTQAVFYCSANDFNSATDKYKITVVNKISPSTLLLSTDTTNGRSNVFTIPGAGDFRAECHILRQDVPIGD